MAPLLAAQKAVLPHARESLLQMNGYLAHAETPLEQLTDYVTPTSFPRPQSLDSAHARPEEVEADDRRRGRPYGAAYAFGAEKTPASRDNLHFAVRGQRAGTLFAMIQQRTRVGP